MAAIVDKMVDFANLKYQAGFGNHFATEALEGALPVAQNSPQVCAYGLYAEQVNGTAFTCPRGKNFHCWLYRIRPPLSHTKMQEISNDSIDFNDLVSDPNQYRWRPFDFAKSADTTFVNGLSLISGAGDPSMKSGLAIYTYGINASMGSTAMHNSDGDYLIVPQEGTLRIQTEMGLLVVEQQEICVIPRGIKFAVNVDGPSRGYVLEVFEGHFEIPSLGPIGSNGLANPRDFEIPVAYYQDVDEQCTVVNKFGGKMWSAQMSNSPFDVVAWHGNYYPCKYDLRKFNCMNSVTYDHPDPSIYTVLTCQTQEPGVAVCDFVIFPPRWMVMEHSFRPPFYHRNTMAEFMGMIWGKYDAKEGFMPGGASMHSCMTAHGPDGNTFLKASSADLKPEFFDAGLAFMFESTYQLKLSKKALAADNLETDYMKCWEKLPKTFNPNQK